MMDGDVIEYLHRRPLVKASSGKTSQSLALTQCMSSYGVCVALINRSVTDRANYLIEHKIRQQGPQGSGRLTSPETMGE